LPGVWAAAFVLVLLSDATYVAWHTATLMETALWGALVTAAVLVSSREIAGARESLRLGAIVTLLVLTRPEALLWGPVLAGLFYFSRTNEMSRADTARQMAPTLVAFVLTAGMLTIFRLGYFGFPLPNTYYAKVAPSIDYTLHEGSKYLDSFVRSSPVVSAAVLAVIGSTLHVVQTRFRDTKTFALTVAAGTGLVVPVLTGGDHFDGFRFYQPIYPLLLLTLVNCLRRVVPHYIPLSVRSRADARLKLVATAAGLGLYVVWQAVGWISFDRAAVLGREFDIANTGRRVGERASTVFEGLQPLPDIATIAVGGLKYAYRGPVTDLMGLNDTRMAHNGGDRVGVRSHAAFEAETFYEMKPKIVLPLPGNHSGSLASVEHQDAFVRVVLKGLLEQRKFEEKYQLAELRKHTGAGVVTFAAWYERDFLSSLSATGGFQIVAANGEQR
jgi:hypothetical protein